MSEDMHRLKDAALELFDDVWYDPTFRLLVVWASLTWLIHSIMS